MTQIGGTNADGPPSGECRSCGSAELEVFLRLGDLPLSDGFLREEQLSQREPRFPLDVAFCTRCTLVQILETVPPEQLFCDDYPYYSSFTDTLLVHSERNVEELIDSRGLDSSSSVVELASNDGYLLQFYHRAGIPCLGIDPAEGPVRVARERGIESICDFFGRELAEKVVAERGKVDVVHANNVLAHVADTNGFVAGIATLLKDDGVAVIEAPYVRELIEHCEFDTIYHEHLCYFSVTALDALFARHELCLQDVRELTIHGGSLRLFVGHANERSDKVEEMLANERREGVDSAADYASFADRVTKLRARLREIVAKVHESGGRIAAYGAAAKGTILLNYCGLDHDLVEFAVDRNVHKQGKWIPGVRIPIYAPERLLEEMPSHTLLLPWNFQAEILEQQAEYRRRGGKFIVPVPWPEIVE